MAEATVIHTVGTKVWIKDDKEAWVKAEVVKVEDEYLLVKSESGAELRCKPEDGPLQNPDSRGVDVSAVSTFDGPNVAGNLHAARTGRPRPTPTPHAKTETTLLAPPAACIDACCLSQVHVQWGGCRPLDAPIAACTGCSCASPHTCCCVRLLRLSDAGHDPPVIPP